MKKVWFKKEWITGARLSIVGLLLLSITLIAYQSTLAQAFQRTAFVNYASASKDNGEQDSLPVYDKTIEAKQFDRNDTRLAASQVLKAQQMETQQNYSAAEELYKEALRIDEKAFGENSYALIADLRGLGHALARQNKNAEAEAILVRLIALEQKLHGTETPMAANDKSSLAGVYIEQKKFAQAEKLLESCLAFNQERFGPESLQVAVDLSNFGVLHSAMDNEPLALDAFNRAIGIAGSTKFASKPEARGVKAGYDKFWEKLRQKYIANTGSGEFPREAFEKASRLSKERKAFEAEAVLREGLDRAVGSSAPKTDLAKYLVRLANALFDQGKDKESILWASIAGEMLNSSSDSSLLPWKINLRSYLAMSFERLSSGETLGRNALLKYSSAMYESAIRLSSMKGSEVNDAWRKLLASGRASVQARLRVASMGKDWS